jgi:acetyl esterase/lipase
MNRIQLIGFMAAAMMIACGGAPPTERARIRIDEVSAQSYAVLTDSNLAYGPAASNPQCTSSDETANCAHLLDVYAPEDPNNPGAILGGPLGAIVLIHGGGWTTGDKTESMMVSDSRELASLGYVVFNINYRTVRTEGTCSCRAPVIPETCDISETNCNLNDMPNPNEVVIWPTPFLDVQLAIRWVRANSSRYNVDRSKICALGYSAGAHLAVMAGAISTIWSGDVANILPYQSPTVAAVVSNSGPTNLYLDIYGRSSPSNPDSSNYAVNASDFYGERALVNLYGNPSDARAFANTSPALWVSSKMSPVAMTHGDLDNVVPVGQTADLQFYLSAHGIPSTLNVYHGGHVFTLSPSGLMSADVRQSQYINPAVAWAFANARWPK